MKCKCPMCNGTGRVEVDIKPTSDQLKMAAKNMRKQGFTIRQIAATLGFKHPGSITHLLK